MRSYFLILLSTLALFVAACSSPSELPENIGGSGGLTNQSKKTPCATNEGPDSDSDGLSDACERILGTDPNKKDTDGDGIEDRFDDPPNTNIPPEVKNDWFQNAMETLGPSLMAGSMALTNQDIGGVSVYLTQQRFFVSDGTAKFVPTTVAGDSLEKMCGSTRVIYFRVAADVKKCPGADINNCNIDPTAELLELCGPVTLPPAAQEINQEVKLINFTWTAGRANLIPFDPGILKTQDVEAKTTLTMKATLPTGNPQYAMRLETNWDSDWRVAGKTLDGQTQIQTSNVKYEKSWQRFDLDKHTTADPPKGMIGWWANAD